MIEINADDVSTDDEPKGVDYDFVWVTDFCTCFLDHDVEPSDVEWNEPFIELVKYPSGTKGRFGRNIIKQLFTEAGLEVKRRPTKDKGKYEWLIKDTRIAIKTSFEGKNGVWFFQQIREPDNYDFLFWIGISPHDLKCFVIHSSEINELIHSKDLTEQHGRNRFWCIIEVNSKPDWYQGDAKLDTAVNIISKHTDGTHKAYRGQIQPIKT